MPHDRTLQEAVFADLDLETSIDADNLGVSAEATSSLKNDLALA